MDRCGVDQAMNADMDRCGVDQAIIVDDNISKKVTDLEKERICKVELYQVDKRIKFKVNTFHGMNNCSNVEKLIHCLTQCASESQLTSKLCEIIRMNWKNFNGTVKNILKNNGWSGDVEGQFNGPIQYREHFLSELLNIDEPDSQINVQKSTHGNVVDINTISPWNE